MDSGILGMEWIDGWSVREMLGGGAEGEDDDEDEDEGEDLEALQDLTLKEQERAASERAHQEAKMKRLQEAEGALGQLGISPGESHRKCFCHNDMLMPTSTSRGSHGSYWHSTGQDARQLDSSWRPDDFEHDASALARPNTEL